jgi:hypothetical protein
MTAVQLHPLLDRSQCFSKEKMQKISLVDSFVQWLASLHIKSVHSNSHTQIKEIHLDLLYFNLYKCIIPHFIIKMTSFIYNKFINLEVTTGFWLLQGGPQNDPVFDLVLIIPPCNE